MESFSDCSMVKDVIYCQCTSPEHMVEITRFDTTVVNQEYDEPELYISTQLVPKPFLQRLWYALRYLFKRDLSNTSGWTDCLVTESSARRLHNMTQEYLDNLSKYKRLKEVDDSGYLPPGFG